MTRGRVYLRGRIWWVAYYHKGKDHCETSRSTDKADAERLLAKRLGEIGADQAGVKKWSGPEGERVLVTSLLDDLMLAYEVGKARSLRTATYRLAPLRRSFAGERVGSIDTSRLRRYIVEQARYRKALGTIKLELSFLRRAFTMAMEEGRIGSVPHFPTIALDNTRQGFFEEADFRAMVTHLPEYLKDPVVFLYLSGWRKQEVLDLKWSEVDLQGKVVKLPPGRSKSGKGRTLPLVGELWEIIERRSLEYWTKDNGFYRLLPYVFHMNGQPIKDIRKAWHTACRKAGLAGMLVHDLRRTAVRNLLRAGVSQATAMKITGHTTDTVFRRYDIVNEEDIREAQERMQRYLAASEEGRRVLPMEGS